MLLRILFAVCLMLASTAARAQWWPFGPRDYEDCAASVEKTATTKDARAAQMAECDAKFAGRRKPGGGYTYFDIMQNRSFDIAGPNPTPEELRKIDEEYTAYLERQRHSAIVTALTEKQRQLAEAERIRSASADPATTASITTTTAPPPLPRSRAAHRPVQRCEGLSLSCTWTTLSDQVKKLFGPPSKSKAPART